VLKLCGYAPIAKPQAAGDAAGDPPGKSVEENRMEKTLTARNLSDVGGFVVSLALVGLALVGMSGVIYHILAPDGLVGPWLGHLWASHPISTVLVIVGLAVMGLTVRSRPSLGRRSTWGGSDSPLYVFIALGTFFAVKWLLNGML
jgi:hypothetical protein